MRDARCEMRDAANERSRGCEVKDGRMNPVFTIPLG
jgi:hypothetical protein